MIILDSEKRRVWAARAALRVRTSLFRRISSGLRLRLPGAQDPDGCESENEVRRDDLDVVLCLKLRRQARTRDVNTQAVSAKQGGTTATGAHY